MKQFLCLLLALLGFNLIFARETYIKITANNDLCDQTIIEAVVNSPLSNLGVYKVFNITTGSSSVVQLIDSHRIIFVLSNRLRAKEVATYKLVKTEEKNNVLNGVSIDTTNAGLLATVNGKILFNYNTSITLPPQQFLEIYSRSGFIHPLFSPSGKILTDDFPVGHAHQHGIMSTWANATFKGVNHDFWNQHFKKGNVKHVKVESITQGSVFTDIRVRLQHYSYEFGEVLSELWIIRIYPFTKYFLYDIYSEQKNTTTDTLFLNKYPYGGMAFRGNKEWNSDDSLHFKTKWNIFTNTASVFESLNGTRAGYVSVSGKINNEYAGVTIFGFPDNYDYPQTIRVHPSMPYWCFNPTFNKSFSINPGETYKSKFRYYVHDGKPNKERLDQLHNDLIHPPKVTVFYK